MLKRSAMLSAWQQHAWVAGSQTTKKETEADENKTKQQKAKLSCRIINIERKTKKYTHSRVPTLGILSKQPHIKAFSEKRNQREMI
jgi:hypothetical protein